MRTRFMWNDPAGNIVCDADPFQCIIWPDESAFIIVQDQTIGADARVLISETSSSLQAWIVIHQEQEGAPGPVIGQALIGSGLQTDKMVEIDLSMVTDTLFAMLHEETGVLGVYEFPDADPPID